MNGEVDVKAESPQDGISRAAPDGSIEQRTFRIERLGTSADHRGFVYEPVADGELAAFRNVHVVVTAPGFVRGNHYHPHADEVMTIVGPAHARVRVDGAIEDIEVGAGEVVRLMLPAGTPHAVRNTGTTDGLIVSFSTLPHTEGGTVRMQLLD